MLKNYFKIAIAVLRRKKFFTLISLFGISFTLTILMVLTAFVDKLVNDPYPDKKRDRSLYITSIEETGSKSGSMNGGMMSFYFLNHYIGGMKTPVEIGLSSMSNTTNTYVNNKKIAVDYKYTNAAYWDILEYDFLEGKPYSAQQVANGNYVAVISEDARTEYFGDSKQVVGRYIEADNVSYRVIGVVKNIPKTTYSMFSDIYLPYTVSKMDYNDRSYMGNYSAILLARSKADVSKMRDEYDQIIRRVPMERDEFDKIYSHAESYFDGYINTNNNKVSGRTLVTLAITLFVFLLMLLPTLNLININITRIMERSSEIGVRKAFGASARTLVYQFLVENIILTLLGGLVGVILSFVVIQVLNNAALIANFELSLNFTVLCYGLLACLVFGLLSGVYPAWRMSRLNVVNALKG